MNSLHTFWNELLPLFSTMAYALLIIIPLLIAVAYLTYAERKVIAAMQAKRSGGVAAGRKTRAGLRKQRLLRQVEARGAEHRVFGSWMMFRIECQAGHTLRRLSVSERAPRRRG